MLDTLNHLHTNIKSVQTAEAAAVKLRKAGT